MRPALPLLLLLSLGCAEDRGRGEVVGSLSVPDCERGEDLDEVCGVGTAPEACRAFDLGVDFFALERFGEQAVMRMQQGGRPFAKTDGLSIEIRDFRLLRGNLGRRLPVGPDSNIRAALGLFERCPDSTQNFELQGEITFSSFGVDKGDKIAGTLDFLEVRDGRGDGPGKVLGVLHGDFDFTLRKGPPYQQFSGR